MTLRLEVVRDIDVFESEWTELANTAAPENPFASPGWLIPWAHHFVRSGDLRLLAIRDRNALVAVAPFYVLRHGLGAHAIATELHLLGAGRATALTELPQVLVAEVNARPVLQFLFQALIDTQAEFDWLHVTLTPGQGWLVPQWARRNSTRALVLQKTTRAAVVIEGIRREQLAHSVSPNLREALRKSTARLTREGHAWSISTAESAHEVEEALATFFRLHTARATAAGRPAHSDHFAQDQTRRFLISATRRLADAKALAVYTLEVDGQSVASQLVLRAPDSSFLYFSGLDPEWWHFGVGSLLQFECISDALARGCRSVNLSVGPDVAKLRWRGTLSLHHDFVVVTPRRRSQALFPIYWSIRSLGLLSREWRRTSPGTSLGI